MQTEEVVQTWQSCRAAFRNASLDTRAYARDALLRIAENPSDIIDRIANDEQRELLKADLEKFEQYRARSGPPRPG